MQVHTGNQKNLFQSRSQANIIPGMLLSVQDDGKGKSSQIHCLASSRGRLCCRTDGVWKDKLVNLQKLGSTDNELFCSILPLRSPYRISLKIIVSSLTLIFRNWFPCWFLSKGWDPQATQTLCSHIPHFPKVVFDCMYKWVTTEPHLCTRDLTQNM